MFRLIGRQIQTCTLGLSPARDKRQNRMTPDQVQQMDGIGFAWSMSDSDWDAMFASWSNISGQCTTASLVIVSWMHNWRRWIVTQRQFKKNGQLDAVREQKLTGIGFEWHPVSKLWEQMFEMLRQFHSDQGHCRVPTKWGKESKTGELGCNSKSPQVSGETFC